MIATRTKFSSLFYGLNQTSYQEIDFIGIIMRSLAPEDVKIFVKSNEAFSVSGHQSKGEGTPCSGK